jgi:hypothetical protein
VPVNAENTFLLFKERRPFKLKKEYPSEQWQIISFRLIPLKTPVSFHWTVPLKSTNAKKVFQISIWGDALSLQYEPLPYLKSLWLKLASFLNKSNTLEMYRVLYIAKDFQKRTEKNGSLVSSSKVSPVHNAVVFKGFNCLRDSAEIAS